MVVNAAEESLYVSVFTFSKEKIDFQNLVVVLLFDKRKAKGKSLDYSLWLILDKYIFRPRFNNDIFNYGLLSFNMNQ